MKKISFKCPNCSQETQILVEPTSGLGECQTCGKTLNLTQETRKLGLDKTKYQVIKNQVNKGQNGEEGRVTQYVSGNNIITVALLGDEILDYRINTKPAGYTPDKFYDYFLDIVDRLVNFQFQGE